VIDVTVQRRPRNRSTLDAWMPRPRSSTPGSPATSVRRSGSTGALAATAEASPRASTTASPAMASARYGITRAFSSAAPARTTRSASPAIIRSADPTSTACILIAVSITSVVSTPMTSAAGQARRSAAASEPPTAPRPTTAMRWNPGVSSGRRSPSTMGRRVPPPVTARPTRAGPPVRRRSTARSPGR